MKSTTSINLNLQLPNYSVAVYAVQGDTMSREIEAALFDGQTPFTPPAGALGTVRYYKPDGTSGFYDTLEDEETVAVTWDDNVATIRLAEQTVTVPGEVLVQLSFYSAEAERLSAFTFRLFVEKNPYSDQEFESTDYYSVLTARIAAVLNVTTHAPSINNLGHWVLWDDTAQEYYDSGINATGPQGPAGQAGPQGTSIISVTKESGTGAAGTTDVYDVNLSDGTVAGTFNVYQGADGQGSPGSATPLMDGNATAGSANAYAREDHVHPTDTSRASATDLSTLQNSVTDMQGDISDIQSDVSDLESQMESTWPISKGGTGATTAAGARTNLDLDVTSSSVTTTYGILYGRKIPGLKLCCVSIVGNSTYIPTGDSNVPHTFPYPPAQETNIALGKAVYVTIMPTGAMSWHNATGSQQRYCSGSSAFITAS